MSAREPWEGRRTAHTDLAGDLGLPRYNDAELRAMANAEGLPEPVQSSAGFWDDAAVIHVYTRERALEDGVLMDARQGAIEEVTRQHMGPSARAPRPVPVVLTSALFELIQRAVAHPRHCNDWRGVWHDVLTMSTGARRSALATGRAAFRVIITGTGRQRLHTLAVCWDGEAFTFMLEGED